MTFNYKTAVLCAVMLGAAGSVSAASMDYTFTFDNSFGDDQSPKTVGSDGDGSLEVEVAGYHYTRTEGGDLVLGAPQLVDSNSYGLIIDNSNDDHTVDSFGPDEALKFSFDEGVEVELIDIVIGWSESWTTYGDDTNYDGNTRGDDYAEYDLFADGEFQGNTFFGDLLPSGPANMFTIGASTIQLKSLCEYPDETFLRGDFQCLPTYLDFGFKLQSITVRSTYDDPGTVVPLPAAGWLMLAGLGSIAAMRRRKTA